MMKLRTVVVLSCWLFLTTSCAHDSVVATEDEHIALFTAWVPADQRNVLQSLDIELIDHDGRSRLLRHLADKPMLVTFFYIRCQNASKCSTTVSQLAALQLALAKEGLLDRARLLAVTYEPQFDSPERMTSFATARGLKLSEHALLVQVAPSNHQNLVDELQAPVSFNAGWVTTHGVEANLLDGHGRLVRKYTTLVWDNNQVAEDLKRLISEQ